MPGEPLDLRTQAFGQFNSSPGRVIRRRRVDHTNSATRVSSLPSLSEILGSLLPELDWNGRYETAVGRSDSIILRAHPIHLIVQRPQEAAELAAAFLGRHPLAAGPARPA